MRKKLFSRENWKRRKQIKQEKERKYLKILKRVYVRVDERVSLKEETRNI